MTLLVQRVQQKGGLRLYLSSALLLGVLALVLTLVLPIESDASWLQLRAFVRLALLALLAVELLLFVGLIYKTWTTQSGLSRLLLASGGLILLAPYLYHFALRPPMYLSFRFSPLLVYASALLLQTLIAFLLMNIDRRSVAAPGLESALLLRLQPRPVVLLVALTIAFLLLASLSSSLLSQLDPDCWLTHYITKFTLNRARSIPTYFFSMLLLLASALLCAIARLKRQEVQPFRWHWDGLSLLFFILSINEIATLVARFSEPLSLWFAPGSVAFYAAVLLLSPLAILLIWAYARFLAHLPTSTRRGLIAGGVLYLIGALAFPSQVAELLGMLSVGIVIYALLDDLKRAYPHITLHFS